MAESMITMIEKLHINEGDVIIVRSTDSVAAARELKDKEEKAPWLKRTPVIYLGPNESVEEVLKVTLKQALRRAGIYM